MSRRLARNVCARPNPSLLRRTQADDLGRSDLHSGRAPGVPPSAAETRRPLNRPKVARPCADARVCTSGGASDTSSRTAWNTPSQREGKHASPRSQPSRHSGKPLGFGRHQLRQRAQLRRLKPKMTLRPSPQTRRAQRIGATSHPAPSGVCSHRSTGYRRCLCEARRPDPPRAIPRLTNQDGRGERKRSDLLRLRLRSARSWPWQCSSASYHYFGDKRDSSLQRRCMRGALAQGRIDADGDHARTSAKSV